MRKLYDDPHVPELASETRGMRHGRRRDRCCRQYVFRQYVPRQYVFQQYVLRPSRCVDSRCEHVLNLAHANGEQGSVCIAGVGERPSASDFRELSSSPGLYVSRLMALTEALGGVASAAAVLHLVWPLRGPLALAGAPI